MRIVGGSGSVVLKVPEVPIGSADTVGIGGIDDLEVKRRPSSFVSAGTAAMRVVAADRVW